MSNENRHKESNKMFFSEPLVGFSDVNDLLFEEYKNIIGDFHLTPREFFEAEFGKSSLKKGTVISWILPITEDTVASNKKQKFLPSKEWGHTRYFGEAFNDKLREYLVLFLEKNGYRAVAPLLSENFKVFKESSVGIASSWSERHAAYVAGLGTFSLNDALITVRGMTHRCGSIITDLSLSADKRPYNNPYAYCLYYNS